MSRERVRQIVAKPNFPAPYDKLAMGSVWLISEVEEWIRKYRPHLDAPDLPE